MKKYIRTKDDKIYYMGDLEKSEVLNRKPFVHRKTKKLIYPTYIKQEADTIEELCDEFILAGIDIIVINKEHTQFRYEYNDKWLYITEVELKRGIYGAVWTDEGLIYVAKMNKKGEFELL